MMLTFEEGGDSTIPFLPIGIEGMGVLLFLPSGANQGVEAPKVH